MIIELINKLTPVNVHSDKFRMGPLGDGGYVVNKLLTKHATKLISIGYGGSDFFEVEWYNKYRTPIDIYDGTCDCAGICRLHPEDIGSKINYYKVNVGNDEGQLPLGNILHNQSNTLLKVDIEGYEYVAFDGVDLSNQIGLLLEIHALSQEELMRKFIWLMNNEFSCFTLFHVHANSIGGQFEAGGVVFPTTYELSFVNTKLVQQISEDTSIYPIPELDYPNCDGCVDFEITNPFNEYRRIHKFFTPLSSKL